MHQRNLATRASNCTSCEAGKYNEDIGALPASSDAGKHANSTGSSSCDSCQAGSYSGTAATEVTTPRGIATATGGLRAHELHVGKHASSNGSSSCDSCQAGSYSGTAATEVTTAPRAQPQRQAVCRVARTAMRQACEQHRFQQLHLPSRLAFALLPECDDCPAGTAAATGGLSSCTNCDAGKHAAAPVPAAVIHAKQAPFRHCCYGGDDCPTGTAAATGGLSSCTNCNAGKHASSTGSSSCDSCQAGSYSGTAATGGIDCEAGKKSDARQAHRLRDGSLVYRRCCELLKL